MRTYAAFAEFLEHGVHKQNPGRPLAPHTRVYCQESPDSGELLISVRFHHTEILTFFPDGAVDVFLNGFDTKTTLARICEFSPVTTFWWRRTRNSPRQVCMSRQRRWWVEPGNRRHIYLVDDNALYSHIRLYPDKRHAPVVVDHLNGNRRLWSIDTWCGVWDRQKAREAAARRRQRMMMHKHRVNICNAAAWAHQQKHPDPVQLIREMFPEYRLAESRLNASRAQLAEQQRELTNLKTDALKFKAEADRLRQDSADLVVQRGRAEFAEQRIAKLEADLANTERERDDYMYQLNSLLEELRYEPPAARERCVLLE